MRLPLALFAAMILAGCGQGADTTTHSMQALDSEPAPPQAMAPAVKGPRIAYSYTVTYAFDERTVGEVQGRQLAACRKLGGARCIVLKSTLNVAGATDHIVTDEAVLLVDARLAGAMNQRLDALAIAGGATLAHREVEAEDVTRQIIDTDARVRAKQALAERLLAIIRTRNGKVGELVEAERAYATTQEELDAARGEQAQLAQRVAMSRVTITYAFDDTPGAGSPVGASIAAAGDTLAASLAALITLLVAGVPWLIVGAILVALLGWIRRRRGWRWPRRAARGATETGPAPPML